MPSGEPLWIAAGGIVLGAAVCLNGMRLLREDGGRRRLGMFHVALAPAFVVMLLLVLQLNGTFR